MNNLEQKIEAVLFFKAEPVKIKKLAEILKVSIEEIQNTLESLKQNLLNRGLSLIEKDGEVTLGTKSEFSSLIEDLQKEELNKDLSKSALETLSIILYKNGAHRAYIDYVRGVNSSFTLRALSIRGLIERTVDSSDSRRYLYKPTFNLLSYLGVENLDQLPGYNELAQNLNKTEENFEEDLKQNAEE